MNGWEHAWNDKHAMMRMRMEGVLRRLMTMIVIIMVMTLAICYRGMNVHSNKLAHIYAQQNHALHISNHAVQCNGV